MIRYEFVPFTADLDRDFGRLFAEEGFERNSEYLNWAFRSTPGQGWLAIARDFGCRGKVVGVLAGMATLLQANTKVLKGFQAVDLMIDQSYRGRGIFAALGSVFLQGVKTVGGDFVWGFPNESAAHAWFERLQWIRLGSVPYMFRPLRTGLVLGRVLPALRGVNFRIAAHSRSLPGVRTVHRFGPATDRLWRAFAPAGLCAIERSSKWLNWRIFDRPGADYRTVALFEANDMIAFVTSTVVPRFGGQVHHILEAMSSGPEQNKLLLRLLRHEIAHAADRGADATLCWCPPTAPNRPVYVRAGFLPLPERFSPVKTHIGVKPLSNLPSAVTSPASWYYSLLDFDGI